ncbi:MAG TPA: DUF4349 domain-containing protein [Patescibacteria group bacterium]|nr:DUF4349 domain-containing protein [Patescibacteria group bacterium]
MNRSTARRTRLAAAFAVLLLVLAACGADAGGDQNLGANPRDGGDGERAAVDSEAGGQPDEGGSGVTDADDFAAPPFAAPIEQRIVKTGEVTLEVEQVGEALGRVRALAVELGGYVGGSQAGTLDDRASLTIRIPAAAFDEAIARLHEMDAEVVAEATREQDVTGQVVDLEARIDNLRASETSYRELVARAERVEDILAVQSRLDEVRGQIEQLTAQLDAIEGQAALSTLTITLVPKAAPIVEQSATWDPGAQLDRALASLMGIGQGLLDGAIWFAVVWMPILLVLSIIALIALRGVLEVRRRLPMARHEPRPAGDDAAA